MVVIRARALGFCMGVRRAVDLAFAEASACEKAGAPVYTLGPLIHNPQVLSELKRRGVQTLDKATLPADLRGASVIIRAHGVGPQTEAELRRRGANVIDATCPRVKSSQLKAAAFAQAGCRLFLAGEERHAEITGIRGYAGTAVCAVVSCAAEAEAAAQAAAPCGQKPPCPAASCAVVSSVAEAETAAQAAAPCGQKPPCPAASCAVVSSVAEAEAAAQAAAVPCVQSPPCPVVSCAAEAKTAAQAVAAQAAAANPREGPPDAKTALIGQTTISAEEYRDIGAAIARYFPDLEIAQTICAATRERQDSLREIADRVDAVVVAGGKDSANTRRLLAIAQTAGKPCALAEKAADIPPGFFRLSAVGLASGTSTPDAAIDEIERALR